MPEAETIDNRIAEIERRRMFLEDQHGKTFDEFMEDRSVAEASVHDIQIAIQACLDVSKHLLAVKNIGTPSDLAGSFELLARNKIVTKDLAEKLKEATGMRNVIVHSYTHVDYMKIYNAIQNNLGDFDEFVSQIGDYLKRERVI